jgi:hypothetical protein
LAVSVITVRSIIGAAQPNQTGLIMASTSSAPVVLHEYKTTALLLLIPLLTFVGCLLVGSSIAFPLLIPSAGDPSNRGSLLIGWVAGLGAPVLAVLVWLLVPAVITTFDPGRRVVRVEWRRPFGRSAKEYRVDDIAEFRPVSAGRRSYALNMVLKSGERVRLHYGGTSNIDGIRRTAERMMQTVGLAPAMRELRL